MIRFDDAHRAVFYPEDRRFRVWLSGRALIVLIILVLTPLAAAWIQHAVLGLPQLAPTPASVSGAPTGPHGFPFWIRWSHFFNLFFIFMLMRSGLSILMDHPRLYWNDHCTPGTEWIRFTPLRVPQDRIWTAKDDARYLSPLVSTPGYRHTIGVARSWHFISVYGFVLTGIFLWVVFLRASNGGVWCPLHPPFCSTHGARLCSMRTFTCRLSRMDSTDTTPCSNSPILPPSSSWLRSRS